MKHKAVKVGLTTLVLAAAFGGLLYSTLDGSTEYYKLVNEVMEQPEPWYGKKLQLHGYAKQVTRKPNSLEYRFQVENNGHTVTAFYTGVVPDTFKNDAEVVLKGTLTKDGFSVVPNGVMAKCPSKYEPQSATTAGGKAPTY
jgi:cytochrome c-type biogenesis protein CcmE